MQDWTGNQNSIYKTLGASNHTDKERESNDYYATDPIAVDKLINHYVLPHNVWECACGQGHLSERLKEYGFNVYSSDIINREYGHVANFLTQSETPFSEEPCAILTNPPKYVFQFIERLLCAKNGDFESMIKGGGSAVSYAWFVWEKGYKGGTIVKWI